jgi:ribosomal protein S18 acetylase RimI-like enzyme
MTEIRAYRPEDDPRIVELSLAAWEPVFDSFRAVMGDALFRRVHGDWREHQAASVRDALERNDTWIAVDGDTVHGFVNVAFTAEERSGEIYMIAVDPAAQRQGVASMLTGFALDEMRARGLDLAIVATGGDPGHMPARKTYEKAGFTGVPQVWYVKQLN